MAAPRTSTPSNRSLPAPAELPRTAAVAALCAAAMAGSVLVAPGPAGLAAAALVPVVAAIALWDARHFLIPDALSAAGALLGLACAALASGGPAEKMASAMLLALARGAALAGLFLALRVGYRLLRGREGLGLGDVKLAGMAGIWLEPTAMAAAVEIAALSGLAAFGVRRLLSGRPRRGLRGAPLRLPFGLFFAPAIWIAWILERLVMQVG